MLDHLFDLYRMVVRRFVLVVHPSAEPAVREHCTTVARELDVHYALQAQPTGMLDAILLARDASRTEDPARVWITWCDQVGVHPNTIATLRRLSEEEPHADAIMPTARQDTPYVHVARDPLGRITRIRQRRDGDMMPSVGESDVGLFSLSSDAYFDRFPRFGLEAVDAPATRERNFLPFIPWLARHGGRVLTFPCTDDMEAVGVNTPEDRERVERYLDQRA